MRILRVVALATCACLVAMPSEAQTGKGLSQADVTKINDVVAWVQVALLAKNWATAAGLFLDDAVLDPPNEPAVKGRAAIRAWLEKFPPIKDFTASR